MAQTACLVSLVSTVSVAAKMPLEKAALVATTNKLKQSTFLKISMFVLYLT